MKYTVAPFSGITGCGIFQSDLIAAIVPPCLPEILWEEAAKVHAVTRRKKYAAEVKQETERLANIVCDALNGSANPAAQPAPGSDIPCTDPSCKCSAHRILANENNALAAPPAPPEPTQEPKK